MVAVYAWKYVPIFSAFSLDRRQICWKMFTGFGVNTTTWLSPGRLFKRLVNKELIMKSLVSVAVATILAGASMAASQVAMADASKIGDNVQIGCTLPGKGENTSVVYSIQNLNELGGTIQFTTNAIAVDKECSRAINALTPKTTNGILLDVLRTNCGKSESIPGNPYIGVWQAAGQSPSNSTVSATNDNAANLFLTQQLAPPGAPQPVLLAPGNSDYALVSYNFTCALPTGTMSYLLVFQWPEAAP